MELAEGLAGDSLAEWVGADAEIDRFEQRSGFVVPAPLRRMHRTGLLVWQAGAFGSGVVGPDESLCRSGIGPLLWTGGLQPWASC
jgi:hypothetical protein